MKWQPVDQSCLSHSWMPKKRIMAEFLMFSPLFFFAFWDSAKSGHSNVPPSSYFQSIPLLLCVLSADDSQLSPSMDLSSTDLPSAKGNGSLWSNLSPWGWFTCSGYSYRQHEATAPCLDREQLWRTSPMIELPIGLAHAFVTMELKFCVFFQPISRSADQYLGSISSITWPVKYEVCFRRKSEDVSDPS